MDPLRPYSLPVRADRLPVPARHDARGAVTDVGARSGVSLPAKTTPVEATGQGAASLAPRSVVFDVDYSPETKSAHAAADVSYRKTMALDWGVRRTIDFEV